MTAIQTAEMEPSPSTSHHSWRSSEFIRVLLFLIPTLVFSTLINALVGLKISFMLKEQLNIGPSLLGTINILIGVPSYLQPFVGAWTDMFAFFGYHRRSYYMAGKIVSAIGLLGLAAIESAGKVGTKQHGSLQTVVCLLLVVASAGILRTVIFNAMMVALGNVTGRFGQLVAAMNLIPILMAITYTASLGGYVSDHWSFQRAFLDAAIITLVSIPLVFLIDEQRTTMARHQNESVSEHRARLELKHEARRRVAAGLRQVFQSRSTWALVLFVFYLILTPGVDIAKLYFERDYLHFSRTLIGDLGRYSNIGALVGYFLIGIISRKLPVFMLAWVAWLLDCVSYPVLLMLHGSHSAMIVELLSNVIGAVYGVCLYTLAARMCPKGLEGAVYGLVMAAIALGTTLAEKIGAWLYEMYGPSRHYSLQHGWQYSCYFGFWFTVVAAVVIPFLPAWTRSKKLVGDLTDEDIAGSTGSDRMLAAD